MQHQPVHCPVCHVAVAPFDPERVQKDLGVFHRACLQKVRKQLEGKPCHGMLNVTNVGSAVAVRLN